VSQGKATFVASGHCYYITWGHQFTENVQSQRIWN